MTSCMSAALWRAESTLSRPKFSVSCDDSRARREAGSRSRVASSSSSETTMAAADWALWSWFIDMVGSELQSTIGEDRRERCWQVDGLWLCALMRDDRRARLPWRNRAQNPGHSNSREHCVKQISDYIIRPIIIRSIASLAILSNSYLAYSTPHCTDWFCGQVRWHDLLGRRIPLGDSTVCKNLGPSGYFAGH